MSDSKAIQYFNDNAAALSAQYNGLDRAKVHAELISLISGSKNLKMLDIGAGSGVDADMFASMGHEVVAAEPAEKLREIANKTFKNGNVKWNADLLPELPSVTASGEAFDVIYSLGAIQYLDEAGRTESLNKMASLLKDGGLLELSYPTPASREHQFTVGPQEIESFVDQFNKASGGKDKLEIVHQKKTREISGRKALDGSDLYFREIIIKRVAPPASA